MNLKRYKFFEERAKEKGKKLFIEECSVNLNPEDIVIYEKDKLVEGIDSRQFVARGILRNVPGARFNEKNANGRIYPEEIAHLIEKGKLAEGNDCFGNHAESEESVFDTVGVWHNYKFKEGIGYADLYCIGEGGQLILEKAKAGGKAGFSTVSFGQLKEDGVTVDAESWELDHFADWVVKPSAGVFGTHENVENLQESITKEDVQTNILQESITNNVIESVIENKITENTKRIEPMDKLQEATFKHHIHQAIKSAESSDKLKESIEELKAVKSDVPTELVDTHSKLDEAISRITKKLDEQLTVTGNSLKEKETLLEDVTAKYETLDKAYAQLKEDYNKAKTLLEKSTDASETKKLTEKVESLTKDRSLMEADLKVFSEEVAKRDADIVAFVKERKAMLEDIAIFKKNEKKLKEAAAKCAVKTKSPAKKIKEEDEMEGEFEYGSIGEGDTVDMDLSAPDTDVLDVDLDTDEVLDAEAGLVDVDALGYDDLDAESLINEAEEGDDEEEDELEEAEEDDKEEDDEELKEEEDEDSKEDEKEDAEEEKAKEAKKESVKKVKVRKDVFRHYKEAIKKTPSIKDVKREILTSKTLFEAMKKIEKFTESKKHKEELVSLKENSKFRVSEGKDYVFKR